MELATSAGPEFGLRRPSAPIPPAARGPIGSARFDSNPVFAAEGVLGTLTAPRGHGVYTIGGSYRAEPASTPTSIAIPAEQYGRLVRMLDKKLPVTLEADIRNAETPNPPMFNIVAEIPGTDKADEIVMLGAHFDSWHASTGATDNAAGSAAMMEAMRILKASGVRMRRTVRLALWTGEEQGLIGSTQYVGAHFASRAPLPDSAGAAAPGQRGAGPQGPLALKPEYGKLSGYFNIDNGTGAIRGVYLQGNEAVAPVFREWMEPLRALGMSSLTIRSTSGTDHLPFDRVGLPGFQFIQDDVEYETLTHHTNLDSYERLQPSDMMKNATIAAAFAYLAATRDEKLPRKPLPAATGGRGGL
jgi:Zn-dependent M28 family amino/carboxypeptidase